MSSKSKLFAIFAAVSLSTLALACGPDSSGDPDARVTIDAADSIDAAVTIDSAVTFDAPVSIDAQVFDSAPDYDAEPTFDAQTFDAAPPTHELRINEFVVTPTSGEALELYNPGASGVLLDGWTIDHETPTKLSTYTINASQTVPATGYLSLTDSEVDLGVESSMLANSGALLTLRDETGAAIDVLGYGIMGDAPTTIYNWSTARVSTTGNDADDFNVDQSPTLGAVNDAVAPTLGTTAVVINEWHFEDAEEDTDFVELYNTTASPVPLNDWMLFVLGDEYIFGDVSIPANGFLVLGEVDFPDFTFTDEANGWIYLFDASLARVHQVTHTGATYDDPAISYGFMPDGDVTQHYGVDAAVQGWEVMVPTSGTANALTSK